MGSYLFCPWYVSLRVSMSICVYIKAIVITLLRYFDSNNCHSGKHLKSVRHSLSPPPY